MDRGRPRQCERLRIPAISLLQRCLCCGRDARPRRERRPKWGCDLSQTAQVKSSDALARTAHRVRRVASMAQAQQARWVPRPHPHSDHHSRSGPQGLSARQRNANIQNLYRNRFMLLTGAPLHTLAGDDDPRLRWRPIAAADVRTRCVPARVTFLKCLALTRRLRSRFARLVRQALARGFDFGASRSCRDTSQCAAGSGERTYT